MKLKQITVFGVRQYEGADGRVRVVPKSWAETNLAATLGRSPYTTRRRVKGYELIVDGKYEGRFYRLRDAAERAAELT